MFLGEFTWRFGVEASWGGPILSLFALRQSNPAEPAGKVVRVLKRFFLPAVVLVTMSAAPRNCAATTLASTPAAPAAAPPPAIASPASSQAVIAYLSEVIGWYRHLATELQLVNDPEEALYYGDDRQLASQTLDLAFEYARAEAAYSAKSAGQPPAAAPDTPSSGGFGNFRTFATQAQSALQAAQERLKQQQDALATAPKSQRAQLSSDIAATQSEIELDQIRLDSFNAVLGFTAAGGSGQTPGEGLLGQIDQLQQSVPEASLKGGPSQMIPVAGDPEAPGLSGRAREWFLLRRKSSALTSAVELTNQVVQRTQQMRSPVGKILKEIGTAGMKLASESSGSDLAASRERKRQFEKLIEQHKLASAAILPLDKQLVVLGLYVDNLSRWRDMVDRRAADELRGILLRVAGLVATLVVVLGMAAVWRRLAVRYVQDSRRRYLMLQTRRAALWVTIALLLMLNFATELGAVATIMGFAAAGIALALQNVILSVAGYFFLIGRFGMRAGDRVQLGGVTGDVVNIGLVKLSLMELGPDRLPTGRVVVFSNSIVFQPSGNFFRQAPGLSFVWNEVRLTLSPDCDYRLAEKRLVDAVDEVFSRYRERVQREFRHLQNDLNVMFDTPRPQARLNLGADGLEVIIRYPAETRSANEIADEVARRVLDAIRREPTLTLAVSGTPNIQPLAAPAIDEGAEIPNEPTGATQMRALK